jgi:hypothetical protein
LIALRGNARAAASFLRQNLIHDFSVDVGEAEIPALETVGELCVVETQELEKGGVEVVDVIPASLYKAFPPAQTRATAEKFEWHYTPKHGSWLNIAENEIGVFTRSMLSEGVGTKEEFCKQSKLGCQRRNDAKAKVQWTFTAQKARTKMSSTYPTF